MCVPIESRRYPSLKQIHRLIEGERVQFPRDLTPHGSGGEVLQFPLEPQVTQDEGSACTAIQEAPEQKQPIAAIEAREQSYYAMVSNALQGVFQSTCEGRLLFANAALARMLGYDSVEELLSVDIRDLYVNPADRTAMLALLESRGFCSGTELNLRRKDGAVITVREYSRVLRHVDGSGIILEGMLDDITERKKTEFTMEHERNQLRTLIDNLPDLIYFKDTEGRYVLNNQAHLRSMGTSSQEDVVGKLSRDFHPPELAQEYRRDELAIINSASPLLDKEELAFHKDTGEQRWHLTSKFPLINSRGIVTGLVGISRDITQRKELEARLRENMCALQKSREDLAQLNAQKNRLMSVLSHDLRSPFTSILGFCEILLGESETLSSSERTEFVTHIQTAAEQQLTLVNKLLDWSRLETGRVKLDLKDLDIASVAAGSVQSHLGLAMKKEVAIRSVLPSQMMAHADASMLSQVFNNLLSNALKFTPAGGSVSIEPRESTNEMWTIAVKDTGAGIPKEDFKKLFKVEEKYTRRGLRGEEGTGLGLSVVAEIVKKHSGSITVESEVGVGTTFTLRFPKLVQESAQKMLVVDDDPGIRALHSRFLKRIFLQTEVIQAADGQEAFDLALKYHPRVIVTDYSMPGMNGFELLNQLKQNAGTGDIPVVVITGKDSRDGNESLLLSGAAAVLTKPVAAKDFRETIERVFAEKA